jgi:DNA-binding XRE family transcriptional regulator
MLRPNDPPLPFPWSSQLEGELRCHYGSELYRVLYRRSGNLFVLLHMFRKDSGGKVPEAELRVARERWADFKAARERLAPYEQLARILIRRRMDLGLTQAQLAERMGTSHSAISRIESGQHSTSVQTLQRLAEALEMRFVMGFEHPADKPVRELVPA